MALFQLLFGKNKRKGFSRPGVLGSSEAIALELDAVLAESPEYIATPTRNPIETGANVTDHVTLVPQKLTLEGIVSNTPVSLFRILSGITFSDPAQDAFRFIRDLYRNREPFDFVGGLDIYRDMIITSFNPSRTPVTGDILQFTITMEKIQFADSEVVQATNFKESVETTAPGQNELGKQATQAATEKAQSKAQTLLARLADAIR
jgi:hypothetical protein